MQLELCTQKVRSYAVQKVGLMSLKTPHRRRSLRRRTTPPPGHPVVRSNNRQAALQMVHIRLAPPSCPLRFSFHPSLPRPRQYPLRQYRPLNLHLRPYERKSYPVHPEHRVLQIQHPRLPILAIAQLSLVAFTCCAEGRQCAVQTAWKALCRASERDRRRLGRGFGEYWRDMVWYQDT